MNNTYLLVIALILILCWVFYKYWRIKKDVLHIERSLNQHGKLDPKSYSSDTQMLAHSIDKLNRTHQKDLDRQKALTERLDSTLAQISDGVIIVNEAGQIIQANPSAINIFPYQGPINGAAISVLLRHHDLIQLWQTCQQQRVPGSRAVDLDFGKRTVQVFAIPDKFQDGVILHVRDLTSLRKTDSIRRDFISNISHELRTPLASLKALSETLMDYGLDDPPMARKFTQNIITEVDALSQMASELLELTRIESGQVPFEFRPITPRELIEHAVERMRVQIERVGLTLLVNVSDDLPAIAADMPRLEQVLVNILHNASKFTPAGGFIEISAEHIGSMVRFLVKDSGIGIPQDLRSRIFERFYRVDPSRSGGGTGLGLAIAKHIVEGHKGKIAVTSKEGEGSLFTIEIPIWDK